jgi:hypothetical protein
LAQVLKVSAVLTEQYIPQRKSCNCTIALSYHQRSLAAPSTSIALLFAGFQPVMGEMMSYLPLTHSLSCQDSRGQDELHLLDIAASLQALQQEVTALSEDFVKHQHASTTTSKSEKDMR